METNKCIFNDDPLYMKSLVGKSVAVTTIENKICSGTVYVIDPQSKTIVLATKAEAKTNLEFIIYDSIRSLEVTSSGVVDPEFLFENIHKPTENTEEVSSKREKLKEWLKMHHIDVQEEGALLKLNNQVTIESPYGLEQCLCSNTIVLDRIRTLIAKMPTHCSYT